MKQNKPVWVISFVILAASLTLSISNPTYAQTSDLVSKNSLRVCADPSNEPASHEDGTGYENRIANLIAEELEVPVEYTWFPMSVGFIRNTLAAFKCDVVIGYAQGHELVLNTNHYLTSTYVLVVPNGPLSDIQELSDQRLKDKIVGVIAGTPPSSHMVRHGLMIKARPYQLFIDSRKESSVGNMLADIDAGEIDAGLLWGPLAGPLIKQNYSDLVMIPLLNESESPRLFYRITMGVRQGNLVWKRKLNSLIRRNQVEIDNILRDAGVPLINDMGTALKE